jgi:L-2-hydroxyglutarate oxidase LhgO
LVSAGHYDASIAGQRSQGFREDAPISAHDVFETITTNGATAGKVAPGPGVRPDNKGRVIISIKD